MNLVDIIMRLGCGVNVGYTILSLVLAVTPVLSLVTYVRTVSCMYRDLCMYCVMYVLCHVCTVACM